MLLHLVVPLTLASLQVEVGSLCATGNHSLTVDHGLREECDHVNFAIELLNNKTDGFLDDLLPDVQLSNVMLPGDCPASDTERTMQGIYAELRSTMPNLTVVFGGGCSDCWRCWCMRR